MHEDEKKEESKGMGASKGWPPKGAGCVRLARAAVERWDRDELGPAAGVVSAPTHDTQMGLFCRVLAPPLRCHRRCFRFHGARVTRNRRQPGRERERTRCASWEGNLGATERAGRPRILFPADDGFPACGMRSVPC